MNIKKMTKKIVPRNANISECLHLTLLLCLHHSCNEERSSNIHILGIYCSILSDTFTKFMVDITDKVITVILVDSVDYIQSGSSQQFLWWIFRLKNMFDHVFNLLQLRNQRHYQRVVILFLHYHITSFYQPCR